MSSFAKQIRDGTGPGVHDIYRLALEAEVSINAARSGEGYIIPLSAKIHWRRTTDGGETVAEGCAGSVTAFRIFADRAAEDGVSLGEASHSSGQGLSELLGSIYRPEGELAERIQRMFPEFLSSDLLALDLVEVVPQHRGRGIGLLATRRLMDLLGPDGGIVAYRPIPWECTRSEHRQSHQNARADAQASRKLGAHWQRLGFRPIPDTGCYALCTAYKQPSMSDLLADFGWGDS
jgi:GNAT superfamily N-acetyltransferase